MSFVLMTSGLRNIFEQGLLGFGDAHTIWRSPCTMTLKTYWRLAAYGCATSVTVTTSSCKSPSAASASVQRWPGSTVRPCSGASLLLRSWRAPATTVALCDCVKGAAARLEYSGGFAQKDGW